MERENDMKPKTEWECTLLIVEGPIYAKKNTNKNCALGHSGPI